jgi:hypothetical protein
MTSVSVLATVHNETYPLDVLFAPRLSKFPNLKPKHGLLMVSCPPACLHGLALHVREYAGRYWNDCSLGVLVRKLHIGDGWLFSLLAFCNKSTSTASYGFPASAAGLRWYMRRYQNRYVHPRCSGLSCRVLWRSRNRPLPQAMSYSLLWTFSKKNRKDYQPMGVLSALGLTLHVRENVRRY